MKRYFPFLVLLYFKCRGVLTLWVKVNQSSSLKKKPGQEPKNKKCKENKDTKKTRKPKKKK